MTTALPELDVDGPAAPPRSNGELVFGEPWEGRAFGLVMALVDSGRLSYEDFRLALIGRIAAWESAPPADEAWSYYRCWLQALEQVLTDRELVSAADVDARQEVLAARPAGHDHRDGERHDHGQEHDHDHGHDHGH